MDPDDAADLLGELDAARAEVLLARMAPEDSEAVSRLLQHSPDTAGGLMTSDPVVLGPGTIPKTPSGKLRRANSVALVT